MTQGDPAAGLMFAAGTLPMIQELKRLTRANHNSDDEVMENLERDVRDEDFDPDHTLYVSGCGKSDTGDSMGIGVYITNHKGEAIFSAGQTTPSKCDQTEADMHVVSYSAYE